MAKIHTHYDNLKVARMAPQEVIRAAYKALSQKYHPDKNPGNEKAARIMAIINSAYGTLADTQRRKEHDEWISAEEWEIEWLESTRVEERRDQFPIDVPAPPVVLPYLAARDPIWWVGLSVCLVVGFLVGSLVSTAPSVEPSSLALAQDMPPAPQVEGTAAPQAETKQAGSDAKAAPATQPGAAIDGLAAGQPNSSEPPKSPQVRILTLSQVALPDKGPDCGRALHAALAPSGVPWPLQSGYVDGYPMVNQGDDVQVTVDNIGNPSAAFVKVYDLERRQNVRHVFVLARDRFKIADLATGKYEVRYQNLQLGAAGDADCAQKKVPAPD